MKKLLLVLTLFTISLASSLTAQEEVSLKLNYNAADSSWNFSEIRRYDGKKTGERDIPENGATFKKDAFKGYVENLIKAQQESLTEQKRIAAKINENITFLGTALDSVCGAGTFTALQNNVLKDKLQGPWTLVVGRGDSDQSFLTVNVQGDNMASADKVSGIAWKDAESFTLKSGGIFAFNLQFNQKEPGRFIAERTSNGKTVKFLLARK
jgi:major membrane immunogen (membrane-anchored lipoprotein)